MEPKVASPTGGAKAPRVRARAGSSENLSGSVEPGAVILEENGLHTSDAIIPRQTYRRVLPVEIDMHLEVRHRGTIRATA